jgi:2-(1,2-epoxy-1,2-dihydrophenyl)acetyl-CoA isomerase
MTDPAVLLECVDGVAIITLNRPAAGNTIDPDFVDALETAVTSAAADPSVRCVVLTGNGKLFCAGGDIGAMSAAGSDAATYLRNLATNLHRSIAILASMEKPLVVLVNGAAAGAGMSLALLGDIVLAAPNASFTAAYGSIGLTPDGGMSWLLPRLVGLRRAQEIIIGGRRLDAQEAAAIGMITRVVEGADLMAEGLSLARKLADGPVLAIGGSRGLLARGYSQDLVGQLADEADRIGQAGSTAEAREGVAAFLDRRKPHFRGA